METIPSFSGSTIETVAWGYTSIKNSSLDAVPQPDIGLAVRTSVTL